jgi:hypothetical protein
MWMHGSDIVKKKQTIEKLIPTQILCKGELIPDGDDEFSCDVCDYVGKYLNEHLPVEYNFEIKKWMKNQ